MVARAEAVDWMGWRDKPIQKLPTTSSKASAAALMLALRSVRRARVASTLVASADMSQETCRRLRTIGLPSTIT